MPNKYTMTKKPLPWCATKYQGPLAILQEMKNLGVDRLGSHRIADRLLAAQTQQSRLGSGRLAALLEMPGLENIPAEASAWCIR